MKFTHFIVVVVGPILQLNQIVYAANADTTFSSDLHAHSRHSHSHAHKHSRGLSSTSSTHNNTVTKPKSGTKSNSGTGTSSSPSGKDQETPTPVFTVPKPYNTLSNPITYRSSHGVVAGSAPGTLYGPCQFTWCVDKNWHSIPNYNLSNPFLDVLRDSCAPSIDTTTSIDLIQPLTVPAAQQLCWHAGVPMYYQTGLCHAPCYAYQGGDPQLKFPKTLKDGKTLASNGVMGYPLHGCDEPDEADVVKYFTNPECNFPKNTF